MDRRSFLARSGLAGSALVLGGVPVFADAARTRRKRIPLAGGGTFAEGIASGETSTNAATLWTRLGGYRTDRRLGLEIASDPGFRHVIHRRSVVARAAHDHTIKARVGGRFLKPGERYWYRFEGAHSHSPVGRFQTLRPADSNEPVRIAFFSCQDWQAGYFGAHRTLAERDDLDLVVGLGDYIYERNFYEGPRANRLGANGDGEVQTLDEYRAAYRMWRSDADLRAMHAAHPVLATWDDHEVEDNYAGDKPGEATENPRVPFAGRRSNGWLAFSEYQPFRLLGPVGTRVYRSLRLGRHAELFLTDHRSYRDDQPCGDSFTTPCPPAETNKPGRTLLGSAQKSWLKDGLRGSRATWKLIGNPTMIMALDAPQGFPINKDQWDGYGAERTELLSFIRDQRIADVSFITGDIHTFFAGEVHVDGRTQGPSLATEFVGGSISSLGVPESVAGATGTPLPPSVVLALTQNVEAVNPHITYNEQKSRGYQVVEATPRELRVEYKGVEARTRSTSATTLARFRVAAGTPRAQRV